MLDMVEELLQKGIELHKSGKVKVASQHYTAILKVQPEHPDANHNMGVLAVGLGKIKEALPFFETALEANADTSQFWLSYIDALIKVERMADAQAVLNQAKNNGAEGAGFDQLELRLNVPNQAELETSNKALKAHQSQPNILDTLKLDQALRLAKKKSQAGTTKEAQRIYQDILTKFPKNKRAINGLKGLADTPVGNASKVQDPPLDQLQALIDLYSQGQPQRALKQAETLVQQFPKSPVLFNIQGTVLKSLRQFDLSFAAFNKALAIKPEYADAYNNMGNAFQEQGKLEEAVEAYNKVLAIKPDYADAYNNMGTALKDQGKLEEAIEAYNEALAIKPDYAEAYNNMGITLQEQGKLDEAIEAYNKALAIKADFAEAYNNMGVTLQEQGKLDEAIEAYNKALAIKPDYADTYYNMGNALKEQGKLDEAIEAYNKALTIKPDYAETYYNMGVTLQEQGKLEEAIEAYNKALSLKPDYAHAQAQKLHQKAQICHWPVIDAYRFNFEELGIVGESILPFTLLSLDDSPERQLNRAEKYIKANNQQKPLKMAENRVGSSHYGKSKLNQNNVARRIPNRIKVGYFSPIFHQNPVSILSSRMLELHDTEKFEIFIFVYKKMINDQYCARLIKSGAKIIDVSKKSDKQIAELAMEKGIDLAIEFNGFLKNGRQGILAHRPAPVQINYLAYPGTMGADFYDYIIGDHVVIPEDQKHNYAENIIYLPDCYMPHDNTRQISNKPISRAECGLPDNRFVFCCFNNSFKISPQEFDIWMRLLNKIEGSVLWLLKANEWSQNNLRNEASKRGVDADRLVFADKLPLEEHLGRLRHADLFLDTFNFNAHTTASDALWAGIPVVTKIGKSFAARVAGSLLNAIELPELITTTEKEYEALALSLASNPKTLTLIKKKLAEKKNSAPLFDTETYTKNLERAYIQAYQCYADGSPPAELTVL
tara:strand:- start:1598 stop:4429 length:2832 start_codon:yes stop_codon:yes gene_type:complete